MSKIEEALKKARIENQKSAGTDSANHLSKKGRVISGNIKGVVKPVSSSLIKMMKEDDSVTDEDLQNKSLIVPDVQQSGVTDSFRRLRTQILKNAKDENFIVLVTSCVDGADSSFVSMNMGAAFSFDETKTSLVIDCDINSAYLEEMLSLENEKGLVNFLENDNIKVNDLLHDVGIRRLRVIPSGFKTKSECEYFTTERMKILLDGLVERYHDRYIVLNAPSLDKSADANILVDLVDYVVVVVPYGRVTDSDLEERLRKIDKTKLLGVVLNDVPGWP